MNGIDIGHELLLNYYMDSTLPRNNNLISKIKQEYLAAGKINTHILDFLPVDYVCNNKEFIDSIYSEYNHKIQHFWIKYKYTSPAFIYVRGLNSLNEIIYSDSYWAERLSNGMYFVEEELPYNLGIYAITVSVKTKDDFFTKRGTR